MTKSIENRLERIEKALSIDDKPVVIDCADENGVGPKIEMSSADFDKLLKEIRAESKGIPVRKGVAV